MKLRLAVAVSSIFIALILAEAGCRFWLAYSSTEEQLFRFGSIESIREKGIRDRYSPHRHLGYIPSPGWSKGSDRHNVLGFRGDEITVAKPQDVYRIACLGGSTTYCNKVEDPEESYPFVLQQILQQRGYAVEVVNGGCPGYSSLQSLINLQIRVLDLAPDLVVVYHGVNDVHPRLVWPPSAYRRDQSGHILPGTLDHSVWEHSTLLRMVGVSYGLLEPQASLSGAFWDTPNSSYSLEFWRQMRDGAYPRGFFRQVDVSRMLLHNQPTHFESNLRDMIALSRSRGADVVLSTWAVSAEALTGDDPRLESPDYQAAIEEQNEVIRQLANEMNAPLLDLALAEIPNRHYVDGYHFNTGGNRFRANLLADLIEVRYSERLKRSQ